MPFKTPPVHCRPKRKKSADPIRPSTFPYAQPTFRTVCQSFARSDGSARKHLDALERLITENAIAHSQFKAILNEKDPPPGRMTVEAPVSLRRRIVSDRVLELRSHPDFRIARRSLVISRLAQVISERKVQGGLRRVLLTQAKRLQWLAQRRFDALGGAASVGAEGDDDGDA